MTPAFIRALGKAWPECPQCGAAIHEWVNATYPTKFDDRVGLWVEPCGHDIARADLEALVAKWKP